MWTVEGLRRYVRRTMHDIPAWAGAILSAICAIAAAIAGLWKLRDAILSGRTTKSQTENESDAIGSVHGEPDVRVYAYAKNRDRASEKESRLYRGARGSIRRVRNDGEAPKASLLPGAAPTGKLLRALVILVFVYALSVLVLWSLVGIGGPITAQVQASVKKLGDSIWIAGGGLFGAFMVIALVGFGVVYVFAGRE